MENKLPELPNQGKRMTSFFSGSPGRENKFLCSCRLYNQLFPTTKLFKFSWNLKFCVRNTCVNIRSCSQWLECNKGSQNVKCFIKFALWEQNNRNFRNNTHQKHIKHFKRDAPTQEPLENKHTLKVFCFQSFISFFLTMTILWCLVLFSFLVFPRHRFKTQSERV